MLLFKGEFILSLFFDNLGDSKSLCKCRAHKIIIQFQIGLEIALLSKLNDFKHIAPLKRVLYCSIFAYFKEKFE